MKAVFSDSFLSIRSQVLQLIQNFENKGDEIYTGRNTVKVFEIGGEKVNVKAFKKPNLVNKIAYRYFRKSKAERSFEHARLLLQKGIGTPQPVSYMEEEGLLFGKSYYLCRHINYDFTFREIIGLKNIPERNEILRQFTAFTHRMHEQGVEFLDHSPGNTLIIDCGNGQYEFYLVDLNRMKFHEKMDEATRFKNFSRLTSEKDVVETISKAYAALTGKDESVVFNGIWHATENFQKKFQRKREVKNKLKFWKDIK